MAAGVAISPNTPSTVITDDIGNAADMLLVMTVEPGICNCYISHFGTRFPNNRIPGKGGQSFKPECMPKVSELRARFPNKDIEVDGGVGPKNIQQCADAGMVSRFCRLGSAVTETDQLPTQEVT